MGNPFELFGGIEGVGAESDEAVSRIHLDVVLFEVGDNFFVVFGGKEGECAELGGVLGFEDRNVMVAKDLAYFGLLGEGGGAEFFDGEAFEVFESGEGLIGLDDGGSGFPPGAMIFGSVGGAGVSEEFFLGEPAGVEGLVDLWIGNSKPAGAGAAVDVFVRAADGKVGIRPMKVDYAEAVVGVQKDESVVDVGVSDNVF